MLCALEERDFSTGRDQLPRGRQPRRTAPYDRNPWHHQALQFYVTL
jgi:hypothetical protein